MILKILTLDKPNKNNRIYPRSVIDREIKKYTENYINKNQSFIYKDATSSNFENAIGLIEELSIIRGNLMAECKFFRKPENKELIKGIKNELIHLCPYGIGDVTQRYDGVYVVNDDYNFLYCFITHDPA